MDIPRDNTGRRRLRLILGGVGVVFLVLITAAISQLDPASPKVDRAGVWMDTVVQGTMVRQVRGPGTLVAEDIRYISALTSGRVEQILVEPGAQVTAETPLFVLSNPEVPLRAMDAQRALSSARASLLSLQANLEDQRLSMEISLATIRAEHREATRQAESDRALAERGLIAMRVSQTSQEKALQLSERLRLEERRLETFASTTQAQIATQRSEIEGLASVAEIQGSYVKALVVTAGAAGVLRELTPQEGEWVSPGARVAVVVQPGRLKAELRIPETQIKDVVIGQVASIDTRNGIVSGRVTRIDPAVITGTVTVDVALDGELPAGARPDLSVDGTIEIERLENVVHTGRPAYGQAESTVGFFKLDAEGKYAQRVSVSLGRTSVNAVEIRSGLRPGDIVILSDMSQWDAYDRVRLQ